MHFKDYVKHTMIGLQSIAIFYRSSSIIYNLPHGILLCPLRNLCCIFSTFALV